MESLIKATKNQEFPASISLVLTNNSLAPGIKLAKKHNIPVKKFDKKKFNSSQFEFNSQKVLLNFKIEMICLAGFMQILSKEFLGNWKNKIINIHPSYLPNNKGLNAQKQALDENADFTGCTVHFVNEEIDNGKIILQEKVKIPSKSGNSKENGNSEIKWKFQGKVEIPRKNENSKGKWKFPEKVEIPRIKTLFSTGIL